MEAIEQHPDPKSDKPDQAKRMQTSLSHLMPGKSHGEDYREGHIASHKGNMAEVLLFARLAFYQAGTLWTQSSKSSKIGSVHWTTKRQFTPSSSTSAKRSTW
jgi:hypothetical protein